MTAWLSNPQSALRNKLHGLSSSVIPEEEISPMAE